MSLRSHLEGGLTCICRCWAVIRKDGRVFGFTDHDRALEFDGVIFKADTGLTASALQQVTGLAVDNTEAIGALSDASVTEEDIAAGRFDSAEVKSWLVNWENIDEREVQFVGTIGEMKRAGGAFHAELRGASEVLNKPIGRVFQKPCQAVLGDAACGIDLNDPRFRVELIVEQLEDGRVFRFAGLTEFNETWFARGRVEMLNGAAAGLVGLIKNDRKEGADRIIELWEELRMPIAVGDSLRLEAGCDKRMSTCRGKFKNLINFRGFPHIPGEDWLMTYPSEKGANDGGSRYQ